MKYQMHLHLEEIKTFILHYIKTIIFYIQNQLVKINFLKLFWKGYFIEIIVIHVNMLIHKEFGDITIGDFWGLGEKIPFNYDKTNGTSLVLINNQKGKKFFEEIKNKIFFEQRTIKEAIDGNDQLRHPTPIHPKHNEFLKLYKTSGLHYALNTIFKEDFE